MPSADRRREEQRKAKENVLNLFTTATQLPIALFEFPHGVEGEPEIIFSDQYRERFASAHCRCIQQYDEGASCRADQVRRAREAFRSGKPSIECCHAGMYNQAVPIFDEEHEPRAVVAFGEVQLLGDAYHQESFRKQEDALKRLRVTGARATELRLLRYQARPITREEFEGFAGALDDTISLLYLIIDEKERMRQMTEQLSHEMQTPIQDVLGRVENLLSAWPAMHMDEEERLQAGLPPITLEDARNWLRKILAAAERLATVATTLTSGAHMAEYRFETISLLPLLFEAISTYESEAKIRQIEIEKRLRFSLEAPTIECSREHLQIALNNLVHNAVKYSFRGAPGRRRYVRITGGFVEDRFTLTVANYGVGILPEEIGTGAIFRDGYQGKLTVGEYRTGSGKGLHFIKSIIDRHHGDISVTSEPRGDEGPDEETGQPFLTRVTIRIPRQQPGGSPRGKNDRMG